MSGDSPEHFDFAEAGRAAKTEKKTSRWADESEALSPEFLPTFAADRSQQGLPTPDDGFALDDDRPLPEGPATVFLGNLSFKATKPDLRRWLEDHGVEVTDVRIMLGERNEVKGFGYAELPHRQALEAALALTGRKYIDRAVKIDIAESKTRGPSRQGSRRDDKGGRRDDRDEWRRDERPRRDDKGLGKGRKGDDKGRGKGRDDAKKGGGWERSSGPPPAAPWRGGGDRDSRDARDDAPPAPAAAERPKLQLQKRTKPLEEVGLPRAGEARIGGDGAEKRSDPFGGARPAPAPRELKQPPEEPSEPSAASTPAQAERAPRGAPWEAKGAKWEKGDKGKGKGKGKGKKKWDPPTDFERYPIAGVGRGARLEALKGR